MGHVQQLLCSSFFLLCICVTAGAVPFDQRSSLQCLYNSTGGASWRSSTSWNSATDYCTWKGLSCDSSGLRIELSNNNLSGDVATALSCFENSTFPLSSINLALNNLRGVLSRGLFTSPALSSLIYLSVSTNQITGNLPILSLPKLSYLYVDNNPLTGSIPPLTGCPQLIWVTMHKCQFSGPLPSFAGLASLSKVRLANNLISGPLPVFEPSLAYLDLTGNPLGVNLSVPFNLFGGLMRRLVNLETLLLSKCALSGVVPDFGAANRKLITLYLDRNSLSGNFTSLTTLPLLTQLNLGWNALTGEIPAALSQMSKVRC